MLTKYREFHRISLLIIEDDSEDFFLLKKTLLDSGVQKEDIDHVTSLEDAFLNISKKEYGLVLLDLNIDDSIGLKTFTTFHEANSHLPVVIMSGNSDANIADLSVSMEHKTIFLNKKFLKLIY